MIEPVAEALALDGRSNRAAAVELQDVTAVRGGRPVWSGASVRIEQGEFVAVLGPNGAGKSTLLDLLLGLLTPASGTVSVLGELPGAKACRCGR